MEKLPKIGDKMIDLFDDAVVRITKHVPTGWTYFVCFVNVNDPKDERSQRMDFYTLKPINPKEGE
jgi:hypothetical protein